MMLVLFRDQIRSAGGTGDVHVYAADLVMVLPQSSVSMQPLDGRISVILLVHGTLFSSVPHTFIFRIILLGTNHAK